MSPNFSRRDWLAASAAAVLGACGLYEGRDGAGRFNDWLGERLPRFSNGIGFDPSERSKSFPNYHISADTPVLEKPDDYRLEIGGLVKQPVSLTAAQVRAMPRATYTAEHHCVEGWSAVATWHGTPMLALADAAGGIAPEARYVRFDSFDEDYYNGWDLKSAMIKSTILAYGFNDRDLMPDHGAPLRLYSPYKLGYKLTKYVTRITFTSDKPGGYWEDQGYPWFGGV